MKQPVLTQNSVASARVTRTRIAVPHRITGIYRLSAGSKDPFSVDIGRRKITDVRSLEIFHGLPMYIDSMKHVTAVDFWGPPERPGKARLQLARARTASFRITADEVMPEQVQLEERVTVGALSAKMPYETFWRHIRKMREERNPRLAYHYVADNSGIGEMVSESVALGMGGMWIIPFAVSALGLSTLAMMAIAASADPWRTYINGRLYKNLKEIRVKLRNAVITAYMSP